MKVVNFTAESGSPDSPEWHAWRAGGIGGSDAAIIAFNGGLLKANEAAPWQRDYAGLLRIKRGEENPAPKGNNLAVARGRALESVVVAKVEEQLGIPFQPCFGEMDEFPIIRSSFDGITFDHEVILEVKVASRTVHQWVKQGEVVPHYRPQLAHQALTAWGHPEGWGDGVLYFANYLADEEDLGIVEVESRTDWLRRMAEGLLPLHHAFWREVQEGMEIPEDVLQAARMFREIKSLIESEEVKLKALKERLIEYTRQKGAPKAEIEGVQVIKSSRKGTIDYDRAMKALGIDPVALELYRRDPTESWTVK